MKLFPWLQRNFKELLCVLGLHHILVLFIRESLIEFHDTKTPSVTCCDNRPFGPSVLRWQCCFENSIAVKLKPVHWHIKSSSLQRTPFSIIFFARVVTWSPKKIHFYLSKTKLPHAFTSLPCVFKVIVWIWE